MAYIQYKGCLNVLNHTSMKISAKCLETNFLIHFKIYLILHIKLYIFHLIDFDIDLPQFHFCHFIHFSNKNSILVNITRTLYMAYLRLKRRTSSILALRLQEYPLHMFFSLLALFDYVIKNDLGFGLLGFVGRKGVMELPSVGVF